LAQAQTNARVIVFLWDGAQRNHFIEAYNDNELPRVQALVNDGGLLRTDLVINTETCKAGSGDGYDTETGPANPAILTGYGFPETANQDNRSPNPIPAGYTFFERVKVAHPDVKTGMVTGKDFDFWPTVPLTNAQQTIDHWFQARRQNDVVADQAIEFLQTYSSSPFFLWVHFRHPDEAGHRYGENSEQYHNQLIDADTQMGRVLDELAALGLDDTIVLVTTDHGFGEDAHDHEQCISDNKDVWIASNRVHVIGNFDVPPYQTAIGPTLFDMFGMDKEVTPPFASQSLWSPPDPPTATPTGTLPSTPTPTDTATPSPTPTGTPESVPPETGTFAPDGGLGYLDQPVAFTTTYHDANGWQDIQSAGFLLNVNRQFSEGLFSRYYQNVNRLTLRNDDGSQWVGSCAPGEDTVLSNSYVSLDCSATTVNGSDDTLTITWWVTPLAPFSGQYGTYKAFLMVQGNGGLRDQNQTGTWTLEE